MNYINSELLEKQESVIAHLQDLILNTGIPENVKPYSEAISMAIASYIYLKQNQSYGAGSNVN
jgi:hypothetical protein